MEIDGHGTIADLIRGDMRAHLLNADNIDAFILEPFAPTWILTAYAELHSNAQMFGGIDSDSFKIKWKRLSKFTKRILK